MVGDGQLDKSFFASVCRACHLTCNAPRSMQAVWRVPYWLFAPTSREWDTAPMNAETQPVLYPKPRLRVGLSPFAAGDVVEQASIHWHTGLVRLFATTEDVLCGVPTHESVQRFSTTVLRPVASYAEELEQLLMRGHGLHLPRCCCPHSLTDERCVELGVHTSGGGICRWPRRITYCSLEEVRMALGLLSSGGLAEMFAGDERFEWGPNGVRLRSMCEDDVRSETELLQLLRAKGPRGVICSALKMSEKTALRRMVASGLVLVVEGVHFWNDNPQRRCDGDVQKLWFDACA